MIFLIFELFAIQYSVVLMLIVLGLDSRALNHSPVSLWGVVLETKVSECPHCSWVVFSSRPLQWTELGNICTFIHLCLHKHTCTYIHVLSSMHVHSLEIMSLCQYVQFHSMSTGFFLCTSHFLFLCPFLCHENPGSQHVSAFTHLLYPVIHLK